MDGRLLEEVEREKPRNKEETRGGRRRSEESKDGNV